MGSRFPKDSESPSASAIFLPRLRHSRRGSVASLSSINQIDKETLSQALDQIHSTASQTDTLTIFNEFSAPPSSSSALDNKGIAGDLQGGISGLYNKLRASVGNAKDALSAGGEDDTAERLSVGSLTKSSPSPSTKAGTTPTRSANQSLSHGPEEPQAEQSRQLPVSGAVTKAFGEHSASLAWQTRSEARSESDIAIVPSTSNLLQVNQVGDSDPTSIKAKSSIFPTQRGTSSTVSVATGNLAKHDNISAGDEAFLSRAPGSERPSVSRRNESSSSKTSFGHQSSQAHQPAQKSANSSKVSEGIGNDDKQSSINIEPVNPSEQISQAEAYPRAVPDDLARTGSSVEQSLFNLKEHFEAIPFRPAIDPDQSNDNAPPSDQTSKDTIGDKQGRPQHLELTSRKSIAPPLVSHTLSSEQRLSRASSTNTNTDSLNSAPLQTPVRLGHERTKQSSRALPVAQATLGRDPRMMNSFSQSRNKVLNKEYWMKDENARDCFNCGEAFSTFRRKHHCRICGQIFDSRCTSIISGERFGHSGPLRLCKPCEDIINSNEDTSELSDDGSLAVPSFRPRHGSTGGSDRGDVFISTQPSANATDRDATHRNPGPPDLTVPMMSIPATRKAGEKASRKPTVLEIGGPQTLARPSSSRSLKSVLTGRSHGGGHRRHNSRPLQRGFKPVREDEAPFHQDVVESSGRKPRLPTFHDDNIIDPDLAPYLSEEGSSGDEQMSIMTALHGDGLSRSYDNDRQALPGFASSSRKGRSRLGDKSLSAVAFASRDSDNHSLHSAKLANPSRSVKRRNLSFSGTSYLRPSPRLHRTSMAASGSALNLHNLHESLSSPSLVQMNPSPDQAGGIRMTRSSSMKGDAAPAIELNNASLQHVKKLLHQLLVDSKVPNIIHWEKALIPILLRATDDVNPDVQSGDDIDIRHYVKLKKVPGGRPGDTSYVSGLVFTKNLALKSMPRSIAHPNILILTFPLEYVRHQQHFMSLEPVIRQEREFLQNLVNRIAALRPQLLLVERNVSGLAMEFLAQANIATAYNVKLSVLEAVSRCCQTKIISSIDKLAIKPAYPGKCASFYLKTYVNKGRKKTYMFLSGCVKELGCTVVLRGDDEATLSKMKRITEFMTYVVYNLKLETCLMRDEYASIPVIVDEGSLSSSKDHPPRTKVPAPSITKQASASAGAAKVSQSSETDRFASVEADGPTISPTQEKTPKEDQKGKIPIGLPEEDSVPDDVPMPTFYGDMVEEHKTKILSASPFVKFMQPYLLMRAREQERRLAYLKRLRDQDILEEQKGDQKPKVEKFDLIKPEMVHEIVSNASRKVREVLHAVHDAEYDKALHTYQTQTKQWETYIAGSIDLFDPYAHQSIAVLYSVVCTVTTVPCSGPDLVALGFYNEHETATNFEADCTLGQYVEDLCLGANTICTSNGCEKMMMEHHRQYVHGEAQLSMFIEHYPCKIQDMQDTILMWSTCRICQKETPPMVMSENTWKYSFGKYLELSFWSSDMQARADICPHDLHREHLRYFGYRDMALRVHYDPITLLEIIVPRARITWKVDNDLRFKNDLFTRIEDRLNRFMSSVRARIKSINTESVVAEKVGLCKEEVERLSKKAADEHHNLVQKLRKRYMNSKHYEIIPLNRAIRATQEKVAEWDKAFADFDRNFLPSEKDIRRLATLQLKSIFMEGDESGKSYGAGGPTTPISQELLSDRSANGDALTPQTRDMSPEKADRWLASVVEKHVGGESPPGETHQLSRINTAEELDESTPKMTGTIKEEKRRSSNLPASLDPTKDLPRNESSGVSLSTDTTASVEGDPTSRGKLDLSKGEPSDIEQGPKQQEAKTPSSLPALERTQTSSIPRPVEMPHRMTRSQLPIPPTSSSAITNSRPDQASNNGSRIDDSQGPADPLQAFTSDSTAPISDKIASSTKATKPVEKKFSERLGLSALKAGGAVAQSMIPRSIGGHKVRSSKVSSLARHFEQLSREFERERIRERRQRQAKTGQSRAYPMAVSKPIVQVYRNVHEAVEEKEPSEEDLLTSDQSQEDQEEHVKTSKAMAENQLSETAGDGFHAEETIVDTTGAESTLNDGSRTGSDNEEGGSASDEDYTVFDDLQIPGTLNEHHALTEQEAQLDLRLDLPKHEKSSILKMLTNFWAERTASGWQPLDYPLFATDHIFADSDIIVREDEPSSLIALALNSEDYQSKLSSISDCTRSPSVNDRESEKQNAPADADDQLSVEQSLLRPTGTHLKYQFSESSARMLCKVFYAEQFDAVRRKCGVSERFVESLSRCMKWDSKGGKTKSVFLKTLDDRFVLKSLSPIETQAFLRFAPAYFRIMSESLFHDLPSVIAKMLGFYQVIIKNPVTGVDFNWFLLVMENLFYDRSPTRIFDLKGSMRNRRIQSTGEQNEVLLDENMVEFIYESPLFSREHSKKLLRASVWNDTLFLARQNVMDYSLMIAIDENRKELVVGIIDCIRTYTWDKKLESWIKDRGKNRPTVTSPKEYKSRFREAMGRYVLQAPNCWHHFEGRQQIRAKNLSMDDPGDEKAVQPHVS